MIVRVFECSSVRFEETIEDHTIDAEGPEVGEEVGFAEVPERLDTEDEEVIRALRDAIDKRQALLRTLRPPKREPDRPSH